MVSTAVEAKFVSAYTLIIAGRRVSIFLATSDLSTQVTFLFNFSDLLKAAETFALSAHL